MHLNTKGLLFAVCISYAFAACKTSGLTESASEHRNLETDVPDLVGIAADAVAAAQSAVSNLHNVEQMVGQKTAVSLSKTAEAIAATAQATLVGKQDEVKNIFEQLNGARSSLTSELQQLVQSGRSAIATLKAASQAENRFFTLASAVTGAQETDALAQVALEDAKLKYLSQQLMVIQAKARKNMLLKKLLQAKNELITTVEAARQAETAAITADRNVAVIGNGTTVSPL